MLNIGKKLEVLTHPHPILKKVALPVHQHEFNDDLKTLVNDMLTTMYHAPGVGLAAPQIGVSKRIFVVDVWYEREKLEDGTYKMSGFNPLVFINPTFLKKEGEYVHEEGCLSVPGVYEDVVRAQNVVVSYQNVDGSTSEIEANDLFAVCLQHENDHLDGIVFLERLPLLKKQITERKYLKSKQRSKK